MPMTVPGGGASSVTQLTDVAINADDAGIDGAVFQYSFSTGKWIAQYANTRAPAFTSWNPNDKSAGITLSGNNLVGTNSSNINDGVRGSTARASGKYYCEFTIGTISNAQYRVGIAGSSFNLASVAPVTSDYALYANSGGVFWQGFQKATIQTFATTNVIGMALDIPNQALYFRTNGGNWNNSGTANPATNTGGLNISVLFPRSWFPCWITGTINETITVNYGASAFSNAAPAGFAPWDIFATNPQNVSASPVTFTAPNRGYFVINGGTVSALSFQRNAAGGAVTLPAATSMIPALPGDTLTVTYSAAPTVTFIPL